MSGCQIIILNFLSKKNIYFNKMEITDCKLLVMFLVFVILMILFYVLFINKPSNCAAIILENKKMQEVLKQKDNEMHQIRNRALR